ncbi:metal-dependent hydrolase [Pontixanthobacter aestiaquae]|uniref:Metal-dependent hydrolase n=1 Tax=Pontixanthobacter aestiaquae TaxID=1509367 RepID=A0A844ZD99_9SPHN|nr:metal-dependent hydrolase [Pontixanthobacter aestiaquae]MDN3645239.1 metal-dependent hydrolase [Pontixanthobacter aestiaquae]MXO83759.1 metal-dependent hydrolase [Pontixanthobacter aestiaquae]
MDNLTHSLIGALLGQAGLKKKTGLAMPALIIGANLPDVDAACFFWLEGTEHLGFRRGITHGPPALLLLPLILAGLLYGFDRWQTKRGKRPEGRLPVNFKWLFLLSFIGCLTHPALDWLNVYGIRLLEPFSSRWFYGDTLFIIDVWLWALLGFATWFSLRREKRGGDWIKPARAAMVAVLAYIGLNGVISSNAAHSHVDAPTGSDQQIASPVPGIFHQREVITGGNGLYAINGTALPGVPLDRCNLDELRAKDPQVEAFLFWSRTPFIEPGEDGIWRLRDARFYDPRARDRFTAVLSGLQCAEPSAE